MHSKASVRLFCLLLFAPAFLRAASLQIAISPVEISVSSATPGGEIVLIGMAETRGRSSRGFTSYSVALTASAEGDVTWRAPHALPSGIGWIAIDVETGKYATAASGKALKESPLLEVRLKKDKDGHWRKLEPRLPYAQLFVARAKRGWWQMSAGDGGVSDKDGVVDGKIEVDVADLVPTGKTSGNLAKLERDDLVVVVSPETRSFLTLKVSGK